MGASDYMTGLGNHVSSERGRGRRSFGSEPAEVTALYPTTPEELVLMKLGRRIRRLSGPLVSA
jgi:hypothetical protein